MSMRKSLVSLSGAAMIAVAAFAGPAAAVADTSTDINATQYLNPATQSSIVYLETTWSGEVFYPYKGEKFPVGNQPFSVGFRCTGFVVNPDGYIATAGHCLEYDESVDHALIDQAMRWYYSKYATSDSSSLKVWLEYAQSHWVVQGESGSAKPDRSVVATLGTSVSGEDATIAKKATVLAVRGFDNGDVGLLKVVAENLPSVSLADETIVDVGTEVVSVGFPASVDAVTDPTMDPSYKDGTISSVKTIDEGKLEVYEISAQMSGGMSGGPTLDADGNVVGINSFGIVGESKGFSFIRPTSILLQTMADEGIVNEVGEVQESYLAGLDAYFAGDKVAAVDAFDEVLTQVPSHSLALEYRAKAADLPDPVVQEDGGVPLLPIAGAGAAALAAALAAGFALTRRNRVGGDEQVLTDLQIANTVTIPATVELPFEEAPAPSSNGHRYCAGCGGSQQLGARFCPGCGTPAEPVSVS